MSSLTANAPRNISIDTLVSSQELELVNEHDSRLCRMREALLVHVAIDRFTGQVVDQQVEVVNE